MSCGKETRTNGEILNSRKEFKAGFNIVSPEESGIKFRNDIVETPEIHHLEWDAIYYGGGVGVGDFNGDGLQDLFFCGNQVDDALYLNKGHFEFEDISDKSGINKNSGWSTGVSVIDIDADGDLDIYVCRSSWKMDDQDQGGRSNKLFINNGNLTFTESAKKFGLDNIGYSTQATFLDFDHDGDLDNTNDPTRVELKRNQCPEAANPDFVSYIEPYYDPLSDFDMSQVFSPSDDHLTFYVLNTNNSVLSLTVNENILEFNLIAPGTSTITIIADDGICSDTCPEATYSTNST